VNEARKDQLKVWLWREQTGNYYWLTAAQEITVRMGEGKYPGRGKRESQVRLATAPRKW